MHIFIMIVSHPAGVATSTGTEQTEQNSIFGLDGVLKRVLKLQISLDYSEFTDNR